MRSKYEIKAQKELEFQNYIVDNKAGMSRWSQNRDFFNLFDLVAIKENEPIRWISIKGKQGIPPAHRKAIKDFYLPLGSKKEIWWWGKTKKNGTKWRIVVF